MKKFLSVISLIFIALTIFAQGAAADVNDFFKSNLKIYVVVAVLLIILGCIFTFLFAIERRLRKLEGK